MWFDAGVATCFTAQLYCYSIPFAEARSFKPPNVVTDIDQRHVASTRATRVTTSHGNNLTVSTMIEFPNHSRSYDQTRRAVRFWGHDSAIEASFFIDEGALKRIQPDARPDESGFLNAFDSNRDAICAAAARIYVRGSRGSYNLVAANF
ncbi:DUF1488 domain-containing protein [Bradyrhizobium sp. LTSPM299]|uniref:DUF1488 domain-containing protein n=1 Tax=Bradyrhizobium sp. LTSPM299 TaxID=1619233 RepID=UPI001FDAAD61|nr:DUF1488 domain-containing protein [Bradyrhizobium sp. LTSPM299]